MQKTVYTQRTVPQPFLKSSTCRRRISNRCSRQGATALRSKLQILHRAALCKATATENASGDLPAELKKLVTNFSMVSLSFKLQSPETWRPNLKSLGMKVEQAGSTAHIENG